MYGTTTMRHGERPADVDLPAVRPLAEVGIMRITPQPVWDVQNLPSSAALGGRTSATQAAYSSVSTDPKMTKLELQINGQPFEIELHDGVQVSVEDGKMVVKRGVAESDTPAPYVPMIYPIYPGPFVPPMPPTYPYYPNPWGPYSYTICGDSTAFTVAN